MKEEVLSFIKEFADMKEHYLYGKCYWFAVILRVRFKQGQLYYNPVDNHWVTKIEDNMYDAAGIVEEDEVKGYQPWPGNFKEDSLHYNRLVRQCIKFTE